MAETPVYMLTDIKGLDFTAATEAIHFLDSLGVGTLESLLNSPLKDQIRVNVSQEAYSALLPYFTGKARIEVTPTPAPSLTTLYAKSPESKLARSVKESDSAKEKGPNYVPYKTVSGITVEPRKTAAENAAILAALQKKLRESPRKGELHNQEDEVSFGKTPTAPPVSDYATMPSSAGVSYLRRYTRGQKLL